MGDVNIADIATLGSQIATLGLQLKELKTQRAELDQDIDALEKQLLPLVAEHAKLIAAITGTVLPAPAPPPRPRPSNGGDLPEVPEGHPDMVVIKAKIKRFLATAPPGTSSTQIADAIHVDGYLVRQALMELNQRPAVPGVLEIDPNG